MEEMRDECAVREGAADADADRAMRGRGDRDFTALAGGSLAIPRAVAGAVAFEPGDMGDGIAAEPHAQRCGNHVFGYFAVGDELLLRREVAGDAGERNGDDALVRMRREMCRIIDARMARRAALRE